MTTLNPRTSPVTKAGSDLRANMFYNWNPSDSQEEILTKVLDQFCPPLKYADPVSTPLGNPAESDDPRGNQLELVYKYLSKCDDAMSAIHLHGLELSTKKLVERAMYQAVAHAGHRQFPNPLGTEDFTLIPRRSGIKRCLSEIVCGLVTSKRRAQISMVCNPAHDLSPWVQTLMQVVGNRYKSQETKLEVRLSDRLTITSANSSLSLCKPRTPTSDTNVLLEAVDSLSAVLPLSASTVTVFMMLACDGKFYCWDEARPKTGTKSLLDRGKLERQIIWNEDPEVLENLVSEYERQTGMPAPHNVGNYRMILRVDCLRVPQTYSEKETQNASANIVRSKSCRGQARV